MTKNQYFIVCKGYIPWITISEHLGIPYVMECYSKSSSSKIYIEALIAHNQYAGEEYLIKQNYNVDTDLGG